MSVGKRDLATVAKEICDGAKPAAIALTDPAIYKRYRGGIHALYAKVAKPRRPTYDEHGNYIRNIVKVIYGTGVCKSIMHTFTDTKDLAVYRWNPSMGSKLPNYAGETHLIFDQFHGEMNMDMLCDMFDTHPIQIDTNGKGSMFPFMGKYFIFTSSVHPKLWYTKNKSYDNIGRLLWRITEITYLDADEAA